ncbi:hypothetical protein Har1130_03755 [Haloarcula sp. CBA1130]|uniref:hypothetical protein n=1 Tax=unclassified Haloarcula TaxID=2624677 RepID=UPI0012474A72|nr:MULTISPECIES: hypothetical protein [unclassified Haloarcula]KAA9398506.1 hypothetical protein Har1129_09900 [Haloarcula sp. CBA1129]KAA9401902.1 hypothetical protein Har1130_03755 [Haloarcula sp. CBA1130]
MERREFTKAVASLPVAPSVPSFGKNEPEKDSRTHGEEDEFWEISSAWFQKHDHGDLTLVKNGEVEHRWKYEDYEMWRKATLLNSRFVADSGNQQTEYVADLFSMNIHEIYVDPPYFSVTFRGESSEAHIQQGKYSEDEYVYSVEKHDDEALRGVDGGADSIEEVISEVGEFIRD